MKAAEIRSRFLEYFQRQGHELVPSASLVPVDDPSLLFTNAGMVQFKKVFLGQESLPYDRAVTVQKCVRAGGKHNDLEQVGVTARHHTFFEMLGNFSFGDYFKRDAIAYAWEFLTGELELDPDRLYVTVHHTDEEAFDLWCDVAGVKAQRVFRLGDAENFWQMADTGPCGPCSELHYDLRPSGERTVPSTEEFERLGDAGEILELWNLVFMQYDRNEQAELHPLPAPSIDTGAGLERLAAVLQGADSNYHTDLFRPFLNRVAKTVGRPYAPETAEGVSYRVLADHARAVAFLLSDGVFPANEGRGYVLRRILRRGVRHAWLLGRREPTLVDVVDEVIDVMGEAYPELRERRAALLESTRKEEEGFLATIEGGLARFDELAPARGETTGHESERPVIPGTEVFKLYDTFGFPFDLTEVMARERGYDVDEKGFAAQLEEQRSRSRTDRAESGTRWDRPAKLDEWTLLAREVEQSWVGWERVEADTSVVGMYRENGHAGVILRENPFYSEAGGQVSDAGTVEGDGWRLSVEAVRPVEGRIALFGSLEGDLPGGEAPVAVKARVDPEVRHDTERNHTATHLLHAVLREVLGDHVRQRGSLVAPDRLRFDFLHSRPLTGDELDEIERRVNEAVWADHPVQWTLTSRAEALERGAMALFGEKYGEEVRVVEIPGVSLELCGGTHLRHTGEIGLFTITREGGVGSGVRRIEAETGRRAFLRLKSAENELEILSRKLKADRDVLPARVDDLLRERARLEDLIQDLRRGGGGGAVEVHTAEVPFGEGPPVRYRGVRLKVSGPDDARAYGDAFREDEERAVAVLATEGPEGKQSLFVFVTDDLISRGVRAGDLVGEIAAVAGGRGGGRPHMAQGGIEEPGEVDRALRAGEHILQGRIGGTG